MGVLLGEGQGSESYHASSEFLCLLSIGVSRYVSFIRSSKAQLCALFLDNIDFVLSKK